MVKKLYMGVWEKIFFGGFKGGQKTMCGERNRKFL
jgi:hypothetical protein